MTDSAQSDHWYWSVDIPGLTEAGASRLSDLCEAAGIAEFGCIPDDPRHVLTLRLDGASVEVLVRALTNSKDGPIEAALLESCREWIEWRQRNNEP